MPLISIPAVFDGTTIRLLEAIPFHKPYRVMVTFVEPVNATTEALLRGCVEGAAIHNPRAAVTNGQA